MARERNHTRRRTSDYYLVCHLESRRVIGRIVNISMGGFMLVATEPLPVHRVFKLKLVLPVKLLDKESVDLTAESRWSKFNDHADWWELGFQIREIDPEDVCVLQRIIQQLMMDESQRLNAKESTKKRAPLKLEYIKTR